MKTLKIAVAMLLAALSAAFLVAPALAEESKTTKSSAAPDMSDPATMAKMMELTKLNENHKLLAQLAGTWKYEVKMWMVPDAPPMMSKGMATRKPIMEGRYFVVEVEGQMEMPGPDGKMKDFDFKGRSTEGYNNVKKKFVSTWTDNMGTGIMLSEGTYDEASKAFTYTSEIEMMPGMTTKVREVVKIVDQDHHNFEWYEDRGGKEVKTMEINYTRAK